MDKPNAIQKFVRDNYKLLRETTQFDKKRYKAIKKEYFGTVLKHKYGYPPDKQEKATLTVLEQAELLSDSWVSQLA